MIPIVGQRVEVDGNLGMISQTYENLEELIIDQFREYQINWLTSHNDIEFDPETEQLIIRFLNDTADCFIKERK